MPPATPDALITLGKTEFEFFIYNPGTCGPEEGEATFSFGGRLDGETVTHGDGTFQLAKLQGMNVTVKIDSELLIDGFGEDGPPFAGPMPATIDQNSQWIRCKCVPWEGSEQEDITNIMPPSCETLKMLKDIKEGGDDEL